ncbi:MAG: translation initiation factor [Gammaproteobacteria bacterium]|nr:translation initiation factor [Gammaproteobacteria bacterium]HAN80988.1 translation initiation factor [Gammaproteobacteria bacterium]
MRKGTRLVYSTELGRIRSDSKANNVEQPDDSVCRVRRETKGRGGKEATVIWGVPVSEVELKSLGKAIKQKLGTGGSVKDGEIVVQGDHVNTVISFLKEKGLQAKKAGG